MANFNQWKNILPKFLSPADTRKLFECLKDFPANINKIIYTDTLPSDEIFQGDAFDSFPTITFPDQIIRNGPVMVLSNTCDISKANTRQLPVFMVYCWIRPLRAIEEHLLNGGITKERVEAIVGSIRSQMNTSIFFLPQGGRLTQECAAFFDLVASYDRNCIPDEAINDQRLFSLSQYGAYLFAFKLGVHLTRLTDGVVR